MPGPSNGSDREEAYARDLGLAVYTVEEAQALRGEIPGGHCKNLFLRNQKGTRHYLVILPVTKRAELRLVAEQIGDGKLSFASAERLRSPSPRGRTRRPSPTAG